MTTAHPDLPEGKRLLAGALTFLRDFARYAGRDGIVAALLVLGGAVLEAISLAFLVPLLGVVIGSGIPSGHIERSINALFDALGLSGPFGRLSLLLVLFGMLLALRAVVVSLRNARVSALQIGFVEARRARVAELVASASWDRLVHLRHARVTQLMSGDIQRVGAATSFLLQAIVAVVTLAMQCALVVLLAPRLAAFALVLVLISFAALWPAVRRAYRLGRVVSAANLSLLDSTAQFLGGLKLAISQNLQTRFIDEFRQTLRDLAQRQINFMRQQTNSRLVVTTAFSAVGAVLFLIGFALGVAPATLLTLLLVISRMSGPTAQLQQGSQQVAHVLSAYETVTAMERELSGIRQEVSEPNEPLPAVDGPIVFQNVGFQHLSDTGADDLAGVRGINIIIEPSEILGVAGPSGAGKTTFADLLVGLFPPQQGRITVGGRPLEGAVLAAWRAQVSYISQDSFLFHDTVRRNLGWANPTANEADMWWALELAGAEALVRRMPDGLDTVLGERGTLISGGERQRLALARAALRKPRLFVLDEATSAIDVAGERAIFDRLMALSPRPTIVIVAHRAESLACCDRIVCIAEGRIVGDEGERLKLAGGHARQA